MLSSGPSYQVRALFSDASNLVPGDAVMLGPAGVGTVQSIGLTQSGQAAITLALNPDAAPLHQATVLRVVANGLAGIASHYVELQPGPQSNPTIPSGGTIPESYTYAEVSLDQVFDALDPLTRAGVRNLIRGEAAAIAGHPRQANQTLHYLAPALLSTSQVTAELSRSEPAFDELLVQGAQALQALGSRTTTLSQLVANTSQATGAIASQAGALQTALSLLPGALNRSTATFAGLRSTLDALDPLVAASKPAVRRLPQFSVELRQFAQASGPVLIDLAGLIHNPRGTGDLTQLLLEMPKLAYLAQSSFPTLIREMNDSQSQLDTFREYTPDVVAALTDLGQAAAYYDANGHYTRTQPIFDAFGLNAQNQLVSQSPALRYNGLKVARGRCPGGAVQPTPDGSAPHAVAGCNPSSTPPGP